MPRVLSQSSQGVIRRPPRRVLSIAVDWRGRTDSSILRIPCNAPPIHTRLIDHPHFDLVPAQDFILTDHNNIARGCLNLEDKTADGTDVQIRLRPIKTGLA